MFYITITHDLPEPSQIVMALLFSLPLPGAGGGATVIPAPRLQSHATPGPGRVHHAGGGGWVCLCRGVCYVHMNKVCECTELFGSVFQIRHCSW